MASGTFKNNFRTGYGLELDWTAVADVVNNRSLVTGKLYWCSYGSSYTASSSASKTARIAIKDSGWNAVTAANLATLSGNQRKLIHSFSYTVPHNIDGTGSCTISADFAANITIGSTYYSNDVIKVSGTARFDNISRQSDLVSSASFTFPNKVPISIARKSASFTHAVEIALYNSETSAFERVWYKEGIADSYTVAFSTTELDNILRILNKDTTNYNQTARIKVWTWTGSAWLDPKEYTGTCSSPNVSSIQNTSVSFNVGSNLTVNMLVPTGMAYTHSVKLLAGSTVLNSITGAGASTTFDPNEATIYSLTPNSKTLAITVEIQSFFNGRSVRGKVTKSGTATIPNGQVNPTFGSSPVVTYKDINTTVPAGGTVGITGNDQYLIQGKSTVRVSFPVVSAKSGSYATIKKLECLINNVAYAASSLTATYIDIPQVNCGVSQKIQIVATDSRGFQTTIATASNANFLPYSKPTISLKASRISGYESATTLSLKGAISLLKVGSYNKNSVTAVYTAKPKIAGPTAIGSTPFTGTVDYTSVPGTYIFPITNEAILNNAYAWDITVTVSDKFGTVTPMNFTVPAGTGPLMVDLVKNSIGINMMPTKNNALEVNGEVIVSTKLTVPEVVASTKLTVPEIVASAKLTVPEVVASTKLTSPEITASSRVTTPYITVTAGAAIKWTDGLYTQNVLTMQQGNQYGHGILLQAGGRTIISGGEGGSTYSAGIGANEGADSELLYLASDYDVVVLTNLNGTSGYANREEFRFKANGQLEILGSNVVDSGYESGKGYWVKLYDGTMICWYYQAAKAITYGGQQLFYWTPSYTWTFPGGGFYSTPALSHNSPHFSGGAVGFAQAWPNTATTAVYAFNCAVNTALQVDGFTMTAIGRWKA